MRCRGCVGTRILPEPRSTSAPFLTNSDFLGPRSRSSLSTLSARNLFVKKPRNNVEAQPPRPNAAVYTHTSSKRPSQVSPTRVTHSQSLRRLARPLCFNAAVPPRTPFSPRRSEDSARVPFSRAVLMPSPRRASRAPPDGPPDLALAEFIRGSMFFHDGGPRAFPRRPSMSSARPGQLRFRARGRFLPPTPFFCYS
jgi:hypothetical protein